MADDGLSDRLVLVAFLANAVLAGGNAVAIRFSNRELDPLWGATIRFGLAGAVLLGVFLARRLERPRGRALTGAVLYGIFNFGAPFGLFYYGLVEVQAGLGQTLLALVPLATLLLAVAQRQERLGASAIAGTVLALAGVVVTSRAPLRASVPLLSLAALLASVVLFAQAAVLVRRFPRVHPVTMNAVGMLVGTALVFVAAVVRGESLALPSRSETWLAVAYLVTIGSVVVFLLYIVVLRYWAASRAAYVFVIVPFVTVILSAWLDDEPVTGALVVGGALVVAGVYIGALRPRPPTLAPEVVTAASDES